ncbi:SusC/RagA family TonB-linked outer membrane protein [Parapedobacter lycopersici]|uniref:SusC/RagA family TonB-linked outer membrane protein n=1 Tax=Parapedobacter lycopersici TaxID=1864939 RepID=UPI003341823F
MRNFYMQCCMLAVVLFSAVSVGYAQQSVTGTVTDANGPLPGVSVVVQGTTRGVQTDAEGNYTISASRGEVIQFSMVGYTSQQVTVGNQTRMNVVLEQDASELGEVVVTALGIERERRSLGYAVQEVKGATLSNARETNVTNALSGKVAGLQVARSSNGAGASAKIVLRGFNSLTGDNQPLIVVDGVPVNNFTGTESNGFWDPGFDRGNGLGDINPEDIESMSVLKGPSAAALYGNRAGNGVILITTKSGRKQAGLGLTISSNVGIENPFMTPETQDIFGQGTNGNFLPDERLSWGPRIEGQNVVKWDGSEGPLTVQDNISNFLQTGINQQHNATFQQQFNNTGIYTSVSRVNQKSILPGNKFVRTNLMARATTKFGRDDRWSTDTKVQYNNTAGYNRPINSRDWSSMYSLYMMPRSLNIRDFQPAVDENGDMLWFGSGTNASINPYWRAAYDQYKDSRDRIMLNGTLRYKATDWLTAEVKGGGDIYTTNVERKVYVGSPNPAGGHYALSKETFQETNYSAMLTAQKDEVFGRLGGSIMVGGNLMQQRLSSVGGSVTELEVPNLFSLNNGVGVPSITQSLSEKRVNSIYGSLALKYDNYLYLDATFRNDWTSTLHPDNRSFFYPSVNLSYVFTDMVNALGGTLPAWFSYAKLRASYAEVGNDMGPYQLYNVYSIGSDPRGNTTANTGSVFYDPNVVNELLRSLEFGAEVRLFDRVNIDFAWYKVNATNQLIDLGLDPTSGYASRKINAGNIQNKGFEIMVNVNALSNPTGFNWDISANFSRNINEVIDIASHLGVYQYPVDAAYDDLAIVGRAGGMYGEIYGHRFLRVKDPASPHYGRLILENGLPLRDSEKELLGNQQADAMAGLTNTFNYKGIGLSFQLDGRFGGEIFSSTQVAMQRNGTAAVTAPNGAREDFVVSGVESDGADGYVENTTSVTVQNYWNRVATASNLGINEANLYDATNIRLRNVQLSYQFPQSMLTNSGLQNVRVFASCNNVWMIHSKMRGLDPEAVFATGSNAIGFESASPATMRTFMFGVTLGF